MTQSALGSRGESVPAEPPVWVRIGLGGMHDLTARHTRRAVRQVAAVALLAFPHGGQAVARRNARQALAADQQYAQARHEAHVALEAAATSAASSAAAPVLRASRAAVRATG